MTEQDFPEWVREAIADLPRLVPMKQAAAFFGVDTRTIHRWRSRGQLGGIRTAPAGSGRVLIPRLEIGRYLAERGPA